MARPSSGRACQYPRRRRGLSDNLNCIWAVVALCVGGDRWGLEEVFCDGVLSCGKVGAPCEGFVHLSITSVAGETLPIERRR